MNLISSNNHLNNKIIPVIDSNNKLYNNTADFCNKLNITTTEFMLLQQQLTKLRSTWQMIDNFTFSDLDDTLLSRVEQLNEDKFANTRWPQWNEVIKWMWLSQFIKTYYSPDLVVQGIINKTNLILTAGDVHIQEAKIQQSGLWKYDTIVVPKHSLKPKELLYFLLFKLKKIPQTMPFNDDRVDELEDQLSLISEFLNNNIICNKVELNVDFPNQIKSITTNTYSSWENLNQAA